MLTYRESIQWLDPNKHLSWQEPELPFKLFEEDFKKVLIDYEMFKQGIDSKKLKLLSSISFGIIGLIECKMKAVLRFQFKLCG